MGQGFKSLLCNLLNIQGDKYMFLNILIGIGIIIVGFYLILRSLLGADVKEEDNIKLQVVWSIGLVIVGLGIGYIVRSLF